MRVCNLKTFYCVLLSMVFFGATLAQDVYVDASVAIGGDGTNWASAYKNLYTAIEATPNLSGKTFHIARGTYRTHAPGSDAGSKVRFISSGTLALKGGYPSGGGISDPGKNKTILTGDLDGDCQGEGDQRVMFEVAGSLNSTLDIDGIVFEHSWSVQNTEALLTISGRFSNLLVNHCTFRELRGVNGSAMNIRALRDGRVEIRNSLFEANKANRGGVAFFNVGAHSNGPRLLIQNSEFVNNEAESTCGVFSFNGLFRGSNIDQCLFDRNVSQGASSVMDFARFNSSLFVTRSIFSRNVGRGQGALITFIGEKVRRNGIFKNCVFLENDNFEEQPLFRVSNNAGAFFTNCTFHKNSIEKPSPLFVYLFGKKKEPTNSGLTIMNSLFTENGLGGGGLYAIPGKVVDSANIVQGRSGAAPSETVYQNFLNPVGPDNIWGTSDDGLNLLDASIASSSGSTNNNLFEGDVDMSGIPLNLNTPSVGAYENFVSFRPIIVSFATTPPTSCTEDNASVDLLTNLGIGSEVTLSYDGDTYAKTVDESGKISIADLAASATLSDVSLNFRGSSSDIIASIVIPNLEVPEIISHTTEAAGFTDAEVRCYGKGGDGSIRLEFANVSNGFYKISFVDEEGIAREFTKVKVENGVSVIKGVGAGQYSQMTIESNGCVSTPYDVTVEAE